jgi:hypothetical protein
MDLLARVILWVAEAYLLIGAVLAMGFAVHGIGRVLADAGPISLGARIASLPGAVLLWPAVLCRWRKSG